ncbi:MAG: zinc-binding dehydrogenase, partial [Candidatus Puniceispirillum sp.]
KRLKLTGSTLRSRPDSFKSAVARDLTATVWPLFSGTQARLKTTTYATFPLAKAAAAHSLMESASQRGKILLTI